MKEKHITIIAVACIIIGLLAIKFTLKEDYARSSSIKITGIIDSVEQKDKITLVKVKTKTPLTIVSFDKFESEKGREVQITGRLQEYRGRIEILADKIIKK